MNVVILNAIGRTPYSMRRLSARLVRDGYQAHTISYPSRKKPLRELAQHIIDELSSRALLADDFDFVGHSMGGVMLRALVRERSDLRVRRAVLMGSPINGSVIADNWSKRLQLYYGPALADLRTAAVSKLPIVTAPTAMIAGTRPSRLHPGTYLLRRFAPGQANDSAVLVRETQADWLAAHTLVDVSHTLLPSNPGVIELTARYLASGTFARPTDERSND
jgi:pimeloyl-ACP methyl ester carboxylesterase